MITGITNLKAVEKEAKRQVRNALDRTLTKVKNKTINNLAKKHGIDKKVLKKSSVMTTHRTKPNDLNIKIKATATAKFGVDDLKGIKTISIDEKLGVKKIDINEKLGIKVVTIDRKGVLPFDPIAIKKAPDFFGRTKKGKDEYLKKSKKTIKELLEEEATTELADEIFAEELKKK